MEGPKNLQLATITALLEIEEQISALWKKKATELSARVMELEQEIEKMRVENAGTS
jgi:hypothetical protein